jgi:hypothetical protein
MAAPNWRTILDLDLFPTPDSYPKDVKEAIVANLWNVAPIQACHADVEAFDAYFLYYCEQFRSQSASNHVAKTHTDIMDIAKEILANTAASMVDLRILIQQAYPRFGNDIPKLSNSIELAARLTLMINVRNQMPIDIHTLQMAIPWPETSSLVDVVGRLMKTAAPAPIAIKRIPKNINVFDLQRVGGFKFEWTDSLNDHLLLEDDTVYIYYHASVLDRMREFSTGVK